MKKPLLFTWAGASVSGTRKPLNDDSWIAFAANLEGAMRLPPQGEHSIEMKDLVFAVSDGMGGGNAGDLASSLILEKMSSLIPQTIRAAAAGFFPDHMARLQKTLSEIHSFINERASESPELKGMAATLALIWFTPVNLYLANVGDSRIYRWRDGKLEQLSKDHSIAWSQWKRGEIQEIQYRTHPRRAALYEVIGGGHHQIHPYFAAIPYENGDQFLICSDGLIDGLWERQITEFFTENLCPQEVTHSLLKRAIENSGLDDTTLIFIRISEFEN